MLQEKCARLLLCVVAVLLCAGTAAAQYNSVWYFGRNAGLDFRSGKPVAIKGPIQTNEGCATLSDSYGEPLLFTDGITVYDKNGDVLPNGTGLLGDSTSTQSALIVPHPGLCSEVYIFTTARQGGVHYSVVDLGLNSRRGDIRTKNVMLQPAGSCTERLNGYPHSNGRDYWVVTVMGNGDFLAYLINSDGLVTQPVVSEKVASPVDAGNAVGAMKISPNGRLLAFATRGQDSHAELFDFDAASGTVSNRRELSLTVGYGLEFSPNSRYLYINNFAKIYQFPVDKPSERIEIRDVRFPGVGSMQLGPDSVIYIVRGYENENGLTIDAILEPNEKGTLCDYQRDYVLLQPGTFGRLGLPNAVRYHPSSLLNDAYEVRVLAPSVLCQGRWAVLQAVVDGQPLGNTTVEWSPASGLDDPFSHSPGVKADTSKVYTVSVSDESGCLPVQQRVMLQVVPAIDLTRRDSIRICRGQPIDLQVDVNGGDGNYSYQWTPEAYLSAADSARPRARVETSTTFTVVVRDSSGCESTTTLSVIVSPDLTADAGKDTTSCLGVGVRIGGEPSGSGGTGVLRYSWSPPTGLDDPTSPNPLASPTGITMYVLTVSDESDCSAMDTVWVSTTDTLRWRMQPGNVDFGQFEACRGSDTASTLIFNDGNKTFVVEDISLDPGFGLMYPITPFSVAPGDSAMILFSFTPTQSGVTQGQAFLILQPCNRRIALDLRGERINPSFSISATELDFGQRLLCRPEVPERSVDIHNTSSEALLILWPHDDFRFSPVTVFDTLAVAPGDTLRLTFRYILGQPGIYNDIVWLPYRTSNCADSIRLHMRGQTMYTSIKAAGDTVSLGAANSCSARRDSVLMLYNDGTAQVTIGSITLDPAFVLLSTLPLTIPAGDSAAVLVSFQPPTEGDYNGNALISYTPCNDELRLVLKGSRVGVEIWGPDSLDLGEFFACRDDSLTLSFTLDYPANAYDTLTIANVSVEAPFSVQTPAAGAILPGESARFGVAFQPDPADTQTDFRINLDINLEPCGVQKRILLKARLRRPELTAEPATLDFGRLLPGQSATRKVRILNTGSAALWVDSLYAAGTVFSLIDTSREIPFNLAPGEEAEATIRFNGATTSESALLRFISSEPCSTLSADITAMAVVDADLDAAIFTVGSARVNTGDYLTIPFMVELTGAFNPGTVRYTAQVSYNSTLLSLQSPDFDVLVKDGRGVLTVEGVLPYTSRQVHNLDFRATFGNDSCTALTIENVRLSDTNFVRELQHGSVCLDDICQAGGVHRFYHGSDRTLALNVLGAHPARDNLLVEYEVIESGQAVLLLYDLFGRLRISEQLFHQEAGSFEKRLPAERLASGQYLLLLQTQTQSITRFFRLVR